MRSPLPAVSLFESGLDFASLEAIPIDYLSIAYVACQVAIDTPGCDRIAVASLSRDTDIVNRSARQRQVFDAMYACYRARKLGEPQVEWLYPVYECTQGRDRRHAAAGARGPHLVVPPAGRPARAAGTLRRRCKACLARHGRFIQNLA